MSETSLASSTVFVLKRIADGSIDLTEEIVGVFSTWEAADDYLEKVFSEYVDDGIIEPDDDQDADSYFEIEAHLLDPKE